MTSYRVISFCAFLKSEFGGGFGAGTFFYLIIQNSKKSGLRFGWKSGSFYLLFELVNQLRSIAKY